MRSRRIDPQLDDDFLRETVEGNEQLIQEIGDGIEELWSLVVRDGESVTASARSTTASDHTEDTKATERVERSHCLDL